MDSFFIYDTLAYFYLKYEDMLKEIEIFCRMEETTGNGSQKEKQRLISENLSEKMLYILDVCFNPFVTTKLHKLELNLDQPSRRYSENSELYWDSFVSLVEDLKKAPAANDSLRGRAQDLLDYSFLVYPDQDLDIRKMIMKILTKRMNIGIGAKLVNKAVGSEIIPDPSLMLATDKQGEIEKWGKIYCEEKYDGVRVIAMMNPDRTFSFYTRAFNELDSSKLSKIAKDLSEISDKAGHTSIFYDGELTDFDRKSVSGKVTQILKGTAPDNIDDNFLFNVFDLEDNTTLEKGKGSVLYTERRRILAETLGFLPEDSNIRLGQMWEVDSMEDTLVIYRDIVSKGGEGVICKNDHLYECKRSKSWIKLKEVNDCDLVVTGWYEGEGKREGYIGGLICTDKSGTLKVKIGAGFTDNDLETLSPIREELIGKIVAVQYNVPITDKHENRSLFLPRFIEVRNDKNEADDMSPLY